MQYNLAVFTRQSNSLLNPDIQPGSFWIVKPNNIVHRNAVTGSTHFDYWFIVLQNPDGPSKTTSYCPTKAPIGRFSTIVPIVVVFMEFGYSLQKKRAVLPWLIPEKEDGVMDRTILQLRTAIVAGTANRDVAASKLEILSKVQSLADAACTYIKSKCILGPSVIQ